MATVEQRVVDMQFNNAAFEAKLQQTINSLNALNKTLQLQGATKGLTNITSAASAQQASLKNVETGVQSISDRFKAMSVIATTALVGITHKAAEAGTRLVKSFTLDPIMKGFSEYETKLNSVQTILANTVHEGTNLKIVTKYLNELNHYSDQTIYNFGEMARNIGTFTAAGVKLDVATQAIKGIANLAAVSGSNAQQASTAMYQLSQAISAGKVSLEDWNSVVNAGMGGKVFQDSLMETARVHGVAIDDMVKKSGSFRLTLQEGWLTGEILTETLSKFTGDLTASQLKTMGYNNKQIAGILKMAKTAKDAATKVKTFSALVDTLQEAAGSGWAQTWELIFGDFEEAKKLWTGVNNVLGGFIQSSADARNKVIGDWDKLGGRTVVIEAISNAFHALIAVIKPIKDAFREMFPATTGQQLFDMSVALRDFTEGLKIGGTTANNLKRTFAGVFAVFGIGWDIIKQVAKTLFGLFGTASEGSGSFLEVTASIGDFLVKVRETINEGNGLTKFFEILGKVLAIPIKALQFLGGLLMSLFDGFDAAGATKSVGDFTAKLTPLQKLGQLVKTAWAKVLSVIDDVWDKLTPLADKMTEFFGKVGEAIGNALEGMNFDDVLSGINTGLLAGLFLVIKNFLGGLGNKGGGGFLDSITGAIDGLTDTLSAMQNTLRAATLLQIALAVGILAISMNTLAKIDADGLTRAGTAITAMFIQLISAMIIFEKLSGFKGFAKMPFVAASMILLGVAINILALAVKQLSGLDWEELGKGLVGVGGLLASLALFSKFATANKMGVFQGVGIILLAAGIKILASAMEDFSDLSWSEIARGLVAMAGSLAIVSAALYAIPSTAILSAAGVLIVAISLGMVADALQDMGKMSWGEIGKGLTAMLGALTIITAALYFIPPTAALSAAGILVTALSLGKVADALQDMGSMSWSEIGKGLTAMLGALTIIAAALYVIPPTAVLGAASILIVALSLGMVADALQDMGKMSWGEIGKGLTALAGALLIIAVAVTGMIVALPGAAALLVVAASLLILAPILKMFSKMSWGEIAKGLLMLAGVFAVLGISALVLTPMVPVLLALGVAITLLGIGVLAAGAGVLLFAVALTALAAAGAAGTLALVAMVSALAGTIPLVMTKIGEGIVAFANVIATATPAITKAITAVILALINAIVILIPKIQQTIALLVTKMLETLLKHLPKMIDMGMRLLVGFLDGVANNIGRVVNSATNVITKFLQGVSNNIPKVIQSGVNLILKFVNSLADGVRRNSAAMGRAGGNLASAMVEGMVRGLAAGLGRVISSAVNLAKSALNAAKGALGVNSPSKEFFDIGKNSDEGLANGLDKFSVLVSKSAEGVGESAIYSLSASLSDLDKLVNADFDMNPTITPVLDLSSIKKDSGLMNSMLATKPISVEGTYSKAKVAYDGYQDNRAAAVGGEGKVDRSGDSFTYNQYNSSPKALSEAEIYRQTKNQLSEAKGALPK